MQTSHYHRFQAFKVLAHSESLKGITNGKMPLPVTWTVYPTNICPYNCGHCIMRDERNEHRTRLSHATMKKIPLDAYRHGIKTVIFSGGGEPLANTMTIETAYACQDRGIKTGLNTNGLMLAEAPFDYLRVSIDAATPETYAKVHGHDGWEMVNRGLEELDRKGELGLAFLITPDNWKEIYAFCEWAQKFKPDFLHIRPAYYKNDDELRAVIPQIMQIKEAVEKDFNNAFFRLDKFDGYWTPRLFDKCRSTPLMAVTGADGAFLVCQDNFIRFGDYNKESFEDIWNSVEHRKAIESINIDRCPRCVEVKYNEIIQHCFINDGLRMDLI